jgi:beta-lactamase regulating signal transducer with metallopeptidase domain
MIAWALTYLLHSTVLILVAWALARSRWGRASGAGDAIWKCALAGGLLTTTLQQAAGAAVSLALPIHALASVAPIDPDSPVADGGAPWVALAWAATAGIAAARLAYGWFHLRRAAGRRRAMPGGPLRRELDAILLSAGVTRRIVLSCSRRLAVPRAIGTREICVPVRALRDLSQPEQRALLAHEVAHLLRHDGAWLFAAALLQALTWWQPLTRIAVVRLRQSMELCCDDWAASRLPDPRALAECLVKVGEWGVTLDGFPVAGFAARGSVLRERVERLIDADPLERRSGGRWLAVAPLLIVLGLAPRVTLAEPVIFRSSIAPEILVAARHPGPAAPVTERSRRAARSAKSALPTSGRLADLSAPPLRPRVVEPSAPVVEKGAPSPAAPEVSPIITMSDPPVRPPATLRIASRAARLIPAPPARLQPLVGKADLERRVGVWLDYERRNPSFDPLKPNYDWRRP